MIILAFPSSNLSTDSSVKICSKCKTSKHESEYGKNRARCKSCIAEYNAAYNTINHSKNLERHAAYRANNLEKRKLQSRQWRIENPEKKKKLNTAWQEINKERIKTTSAEYRNNNRDKRRAASIRFYIANKEKMRAQNIKWCKSNPNAILIKSQNRRARKKGNGGVLSSGITEKLLILQRGKCACCRVKLISTNIHRDHIIPLVLDGLNIDSNIQLLCQKCNLQKHAKHPVDFMRGKGFLL